ncbi:MAG: prepilin peptidase [Actinomycetes bacterium]
MPSDLIGSWIALGLALGSFASVLAARIPERLGIHGKSRCRNCKKEISFYDNIPLISYTFLRGRCRNCKVHISILYPALELFTVLFTVIIVRHFNSWLMCTAWVIFLTVGLALSVIDQKSKRLPDVLTLPLYLMLAVVLGLDSLFNHHGARFLTGLASSVLLAFFYLVLNTISRGGMGLGDAKFALSIGLLTGYIGLYCVLTSTFIAFFLGALVGLIAIGMNKADRKSTLAFGPFIYFGALIGPLFSQYLEKLLNF